MKEELIFTIITLQKALKDLNQTWGAIDWSIVPDSVSESYPFYEDLETMQKNVEGWIDVIKKS